MKRSMFAIFILSVLVLIEGCGKNIKESSPYLSITLTYYNNGEDNNGGMTSAVYKYDIDIKEISKVLEMPYTSQYPLMVLDEKDNKVYFSADDNNNCDQLWEYDLEKGSIVQLTNEIFAINYIVPVENKIFLIATRIGEDANSPMVYNKDTGLLSGIITPIVDYNCNICVYDFREHKIITSGNSEIDAYNHRMEWNDRTIEDLPRYAVDSEIYCIKDGKVEPLFQTEKFQIKNLTVLSENEIAYTGMHILFQANHNNLKIDEYKANIETKVIQENDLLLSIPFYVMEEYYVYNNIIYFRGVSNENDIYGIYAYDMKNKTAELIFDGEKEANGYTNNFILLD